MTAFTTIYIILTYTAGAFSVLMNFSPVLTMRRINAAGIVGDSTITFEAAQMYSAVTWASYGVFIWSMPLLIANTLGIAVSTFAMLTFLTVARREEKEHGKLRSMTYMQSVCVALLFLCISWFHVALIILFIMTNKASLAKSITGYEGSVAGIIMLSSPLMMFKRIIETKNAESLAPLTVCFAFFNTLFWVITGCMTGDFFIIVPNGLCFIACCCQVAPLIMYGRTRNAKTHIHHAIASIPFN